MKIKNLNAKSRKILSLILAVAILAASLPVLLGSVAAGVPSISNIEYPVGKVLWSFNAADVSSAPAWNHGLSQAGWNGGGTTTLGYNSATGAVQFKATALDGILYFPEIVTDA